MSTNESPKLPKHKYQPTPSPLTYHPVVAQLAKPLKVILVTYPLLHQRSEHIPGMDVQHDKCSKGHPVLLG